MGLTKDREFMLQEIKSMGIRDQKVLEAMESVKRESFIPRQIVHEAYRNYALPIGSEQTISQPYTVAYMLELLEIKPGNRILEVGCGSGYNATVMSHITGKKGRIFSLEIIDCLCKSAASNLKGSGVENVEVLNKDGYFGYEKEAPFDRIIITAACPLIPKKLIEQLAKGGIMVLPLSTYNGDEMIKVVKNDELDMTKHGIFAFVPLRGAARRQ